MNEKKGRNKGKIGENRKQRDQLEKIKEALDIVKKEEAAEKLLNKIKKRHWRN